MEKHQIAAEQPAISKQFIIAKHQIGKANTKNKKNKKFKLK